MRRGAAYTLVSLSVPGRRIASPPLFRGGLGGTRAPSADPSRELGLSRNAMTRSAHDEQVPREIDPDSGLPIGPRLADPGPARRPERIALEGRYARLEPLDPSGTATSCSLRRRLRTPSRASATSSNLPRSRPTRSLRLARGSGAESADPLFFAVVDRGDGPRRRPADADAHHPPRTGASRSATSTGVRGSRAPGSPPRRCTSSPPTSSTPSATALSNGSATLSTPRRAGPRNVSASPGRDTSAAR